jgi:primosomal protein N' (replication factor Y) (superfamily II helicase)
VNPLVSIAEVALPVALARPLYYSVPEHLADHLRPGHRVRLPLRGRSTAGFVLALHRAADLPRELAGMSLKPIQDVDPETVLLSPALLELARWMALYYVAPIGQVLETIVPRSVARPPRGGTEVASIAGGGGSSAPPAGGASPFALNPAQEDALQQIVADLVAGGHSTFLLQGITGSGKTEVYLRATRAALERGQSVLFLVPEIALGTQIMRWVRERFGDRVAEYHSQLKPGERRRAWWRAQTGDARVIVGARSALFAPVRDLGLIVVDEEHEPSYKQAETPRYHGRDTALMRARIEGATVVLGSATPSLESRQNADKGKYQLLLLPERVDGRPRARVTLVDLRSLVSDGVAAGGLPTGSDAGGSGELLVVNAGERDPLDPLTPLLVDRLRHTLASGDQAILFLNRRGFSTSVQCRACGHVFECPRCSVTLTHHRAEKALRCHYCNHTLRDVTACPGCGGCDFAFSGFGTQRVEAALTHHLPQARVLRMDLDSTRQRGTSAAMVTAFDRGEADILLGTQMVAKGFDFPRVTLVGVINADREMSLPDFRGQERAFQLLTQVAGRAGRGPKLGEVIFQTYLPDHHVITAAGLQDYDRFYEREIEERRPLGYPPHHRMANLLFDGTDEAAVIRRAQAEADHLAGATGLVLLGPAPMPLSRLKDQYRWHLTLIARNARLLTEALHDSVARADRGRTGKRVRVQADVDPVSML